MDFDLAPELQAVRARVRDFVDGAIIPAEDAILAEDAAGRRDTLHALQARARAEGLWTPHLPRDLGGLGLGITGMCALFREMGRSPVGAKVFNCDAPDQGNMDLLLLAGTDAQKDRWLRPLARGDVTSAFCMTEPAPGAGADPQNLRTSARQDGDAWVIQGHKWYATGGLHASVLLVMARTSADPRAGATLFLVDRNTPGVEHVRVVPTMGAPILDHVESEFRFHDVRVPAENIVGAEGQGFHLAQARLVPARLTHCMRWLGLAERTLMMCRQYIATRESFGKTLAHHQAVQKMVADGAAAIHAGNLMTWHCAWMMEKGQHKEAKPYSSMAKNHVARTLCDVLDNAIQVHGGLGYSRDLPFSTWYCHARAARLADGPDEVHTAAVARDVLLGRVPLLI